MCYEADKKQLYLTYKVKRNREGQPLIEVTEHARERKGLALHQLTLRITLTKHHFKNAIHWSSAQISWAQFVCSRHEAVLSGLAILTYFWLAHWNSVEQLLLFSLKTAWAGCGEKGGKKLVSFQSGTDHLEM